MTLSEKVIKQRKSVSAYVTTKRGHIGKLLANAKIRAKNKNLKFNLDLNYLESIATDECPIFKTKFNWGRNKGRAKFREAPSLDRIIPEFGYVKHNVVFISNRANSIKNDATEKELYTVADWLHNKSKEVMNAFKIESTSVPAGSYIPGAVGNELGSVSTPWTWEDSDDTHHHCGADARQDADRSTEASSGDSMGRGDK